MSKTAKTQVIDADSRDYDLKDIENDPRITQTTKEFWITMACYSCFAALMIANLLLLSGSSVTVLGFPLWIFLEIGLIIGFVVMVIILATFVYQDMDITPDGELHKKQNQ